MTYDGTQGYPGDGDDPEYLAYVEQMERTCPNEYETRGPDPYGASCVLERGHAGPHVGHELFGMGGGFTWTGGYYIAGDPVPGRIQQTWGTSDPAEWQELAELADADFRAAGLTTEWVARFVWDPALGLALKLA